MDVFKGQNLLEFSDRFKTDEDCKQYLASMKSGNGYTCLRCNHTACQVRKDCSRQCNICRHIESATANMEDCGYVITIGETRLLQMGDAVFNKLSLLPPKYCSNILWSKIDVFAQKHKVRIV